MYSMECKMKLVPLPHCPPQLPPTVQVVGGLLGHAYNMTSDSIGQVFLNLDSCLLITN